MINAQEPRTDLLVISPHTDDAEIGLGATLAMLAHKGRRVWCVDLTRGEIGTNDRGDERWDEAGRASAVLGLSGRAQLALPDGFISGHDRDQAEAVAHIIRCLAPRWVVTAPDAWRHPDHLATPGLVEKACFLARLSSLQPAAPVVRCWSGGGDLPAPVARWEVQTRAGVCAEQERADIYFDVGEHWERKVAALQCYGSQFAATAGRQATMINSGNFLERVERRARMWGHRAGCDLAEALRTGSAPVLDDLPGEPWRGV